MFRVLHRLVVAYCKIRLIRVYGLPILGFNASRVLDSTRRWRDQPSLLFLDGLFLFFALAFQKNLNSIKSVLNQNQTTLCGAFDVLIALFRSCTTHSLHGANVLEYDPSACMYDTDTSTVPDSYEYNQKDSYWMHVRLYARVFFVRGNHRHTTLSERAYSPALSINNWVRVSTTCKLSKSIECWHLLSNKETERMMTGTSSRGYACGPWRMTMTEITLAAAAVWFCGSKATPNENSIKHGLTYTLWNPPIKLRYFQFIKF